MGLGAVLGRCHPGTLNANPQNALLPPPSQPHWQDYRRLLGGPQLLSQQQPEEQQQQRCYFHPLSENSTQGMQQAWERIPAGAAGAAGGSTGDSLQLVQVMFGRSLEVRRQRGGAAWFKFEELCGRPLGAAGE